MVKNKIILQFVSRGENVALSRIAIAALASQLNLTLNDLEEIKVATSEAVSNAIIHGYQNNPDCIVKVVGTLYEDEIVIEVADEGIGIADIRQAMQPAYSSDPERMGLGFVFMQSFMDQVDVESQINCGTKVTLRKRIGSAGAENKAVS
ncbi:MAG: anti-sigma F factor [Peptococcaceae bacterium]|nr:anti-sigma F factor [Peptococcaceae bacterium]MDH7525309.1 anti-sigma F factor [Peptococcaceae bacterium]